MLLGIVIMIAFVPSVVGAVVPTNWSVMWLVMPVLLIIMWIRKTEIQITSSHQFGLLFLSYVSISLIWSPHGAYDLLQWLAIASVFIWSAELKDIKPIVIGLAIGLTVSDVVAILQYFDINLVFKLTDKPSGLFVNSNIFAETSGMVLVLLLASQLWRYIPVTLPGLMVSSRAVIIGLSATFLVWAWSKSKILALSIVGLAGILISTIDRADSVTLRLGVWKDTILGFTISGHGLGSFEYLFPLYSHVENPSIRFFNSHNDILQLIFELGIGAIPLFIATFLLLKANDDYKYPFIFFIIIGLFGFPLHKPVTAFMVALVAGQLANRRLDSRAASNNIRSVLFDRLAAQ
jgi:hypothetical protein